MVRELSPEKRERYLSTALRLFAANGIQGTSTADIARQAGTAAGTLFLYFPTKQDLINEVVIWISRMEGDWIKSLLRPEQTVREAFFTIWDGSIRWLLDHPDASKITQLVQVAGVVPLEIVLETARSFSFYYETINRALLQAEIKPLPVELVGGFLYQGIAASVNHIQNKGGLANAADAIQQGFDIFWDGVRAR